jgi:Fe2+ or Zn2+ uptake regulation protein
VAETHGYLRQRHRLVIHGVCAACRSGTSLT